MGFINHLIQSLGGPTLYQSTWSKWQVPRSKWFGSNATAGHKKTVTDVETSVFQTRQQHRKLGVKIQTPQKSIGTAENLVLPRENGCFVGWGWFISWFFCVYSSVDSWRFPKSCCPKVVGDASWKAIPDKLKRMPQRHNRRAGQCKPKENPGSGTTHPNREVAKTTGIVCRNFHHTLNLFDYFYGWCGFPYTHSIYFYSLNCCWHDNQYQKALLVPYIPHDMPQFGRWIKGLVPWWTSK